MGENEIQSQDDDQVFCWDPFSVREKQDRQQTRGCHFPFGALEDLQRRRLIAEQKKGPLEDILFAAKNSRAEQTCSLP